MDWLFVLDRKGYLHRNAGKGSREDVQRDCQEAFEALRRIPRRARLAVLEQFCQWCGNYDEIRPNCRCFSENT